MLEALLKLGLTDKEARVYLATLELGEAAVQSIATKADVKRATTYVILEHLLSLGLVSTIERGKKTLFIAEDPAELVNLLEEQKRQVDAKRVYLDEAMTKLRAIYNSGADKPAVRYFEGGDGLEALDRYGHDQFPKGSEMLGITPIDLIEQQFPARRKSAVSERVARQIKSRMIYTHKDGEIPGYVNKQELREGIFLPRDIWPINNSICIYPEWGVKFFNFEPENPFGVLLESKSLARNMKELYELAWEGAQARKAALDAKQEK
jgi:hypothetical protein